MTPDLGQFVFHARRAPTQGLDVVVRKRSGSVALRFHFARGTSVVEDDGWEDAGALEALRFALLLRSVVRNRPVTLVAGGERYVWSPDEALNACAERLRWHEGFTEWDLSDELTVRVAARFASGSWTAAQLSAWGRCVDLAVRVSVGSIRTNNPELPRAVISIAMLSRIEPDERVVEVDRNGWVRTARGTVEGLKERWYGGFDVVDLFARLGDYPNGRLVMPQDAFLMSAAFGLSLRDRVREREVEADPRTTFDLRADIKRRLNYVGGAW